MATKKKAKKSSKKPTKKSHTKLVKKKTVSKKKLVHKIPRPTDSLSQAIDKACGVTEQNYLPVSENEVLGVASPDEIQVDTEDVVEPDVNEFTLEEAAQEVETVQESEIKMETQIMPTIKKFVLPVARPALVPPTVFKPVAKPGTILPPKPVVALNGAVPAVKEKSTRGPSKKVFGDKSYHQLRKWTTLKLEELLTPDSVAVIRARIGATSDAGLTADEFVSYLMAAENDPVEYKKPSVVKDGPPKKRGRPSKADLAARAGVVTPATNPDAVIARAKAGTLTPPPKFAGFAPPAVRPAFKLPS